MIKSGEYIQILEFFGKEVNINFLQRYAAFNNIERIEAYKRFDELRVLHNKYRLQCDNWSVYPNKDLTEMSMLYEDITRICNEFKINIKYLSKDMLEFKKGIHLRYYYDNQDITDLIIMYQKRENSQVSH